MATSLKLRRILLVVLVSCAAVILGRSFLAQAEDAAVENLKAETSIVAQLASDSNDLVVKGAQKEVKPARQIDNAKRVEAYEKLQQMIEARKAAKPIE